MGFESLLGNRQLKSDLSAARQMGRLSHFYLISGPQGSGKHTLADLLAAAMLCQEEDAPCGVCKSCRKVLGHIHPDDITIDDPEKKTVPVDLIRQRISTSAPTRESGKSTVSPGPRIWGCRARTPF